VNIGGVNMQFMRLLKKIRKKEERIQELENIIIENEKNNTTLISQHIKMLEWISETKDEINKLRKEKDEK
jgi:hypothetical protein